MPLQSVHESPDTRPLGERKACYMNALRRASRADAADPKLLADCKTVVRSLMPRARIVLFGSRARGDAGPDSDYDLLVLSAGGCRQHSASACAMPSTTSASRTTP